jgi:hypothetical protein
VDDVVDAAADMMTGAARLRDRKSRHGHLTDAAEAFDRAARTGRHGRRGSSSASRLHTSARQLLNLSIALPSETRQLLILLDQLRRMTLAVEQVRVAQGRAAQAAAARAAEEALCAEVTRRTPSPSAPAAPRAAGPVFSRPYRPPTARPRARGL